jgi:transcriptional regulator GlxA family with amidase domain
MAGLLRGKTATAPRFLLPLAKEMSPDTNFVEKRWCRDGKLWTSGALLNGLDLMREFALTYWGGRGLVEYLGELGHWPIRDVDYKDAVSSV